MKRQAKSYSIVDHYLLHGGYLSRLEHRSLILYLFLVVVGNSYGKSFYSARSVSKTLRMSVEEVSFARNELIKEHLIDYSHPHWRVLTLTYTRKSEGTSMSPRVNSLVRDVLKKSEVIKNDRSGNTG
jgi:hypothetical protein